MPVPRLFLCVGALHPIRRQCTSSVRVQRPISGAPPRNGCSAPYRVQRPISGAVPPCLWRLSGLWGSSGLGLSSAWAVFCLGHFVVPLWHLMLWFLRNVARNSPTCISNIEIASLEFCGFLDTYEKLGYPNYVRVLVDEAPKANSCVRSSSHDTVHDPRDASTWRARLRMERLTVPPVGPNRAWRGCGAARRTQLRMEGATVPPVGPNRAWRERHPQGPAARLRAGRAHKQGKM